MISLDLFILCSHEEVNCSVCWLTVFLVQVVQPIQMHLAMLAPALLLGLIGGLLASFFARLNTLICKHRTLLLAKIPNPLLKRLARILETILLVVCSLVTLVFVRV